MAEERAGTHLSFPCERERERGMALRSGMSITTIANCVFFVLIIFQIPLFRITCRSGVCSTPVEITSSQLITSEVFPQAIVKILLFPGAVSHSLISKAPIPTWNNILNAYNLTESKTSSPMIDLQRLEVLAGSYFSVAGSLVGLLKPGRMSLFGTLLIVWGLVKEGFLRKPAETTDSRSTIYVYPTILIALICAFASIKYNVNKATRSQARPLARPLQSSVKSKLK